MIIGQLEIQMLADMARLRKDMEDAKQITGNAVNDMVKKFGDMEKVIDKSSAAVLGFAKNMLIGAAAGLGLEAVIGKIQGVIESMARLKTLAEKTGSSVENLSKLSFIAKSSGSDIDAVAGAMAKLSKGMTGADQETKGAGQAMAFLGVSAKDLSGNLKDPSVMFTDIAKKLNEYEDGAGKAAIAQALFGKAGADMLPTLKMLAESGDMAAKVTTAQAEAARQYTRDMAKLEAQQQAIFKTIAAALLPTMTDFVSVLLDASKNTNLVNGAAKNLAADHSIQDWADTGAMGIARMIDVLKIIPRAFEAVGMSIAAAMVSLDIFATAVATAITALNPVSLYKKIAAGIDPLADLKAKLQAGNGLMSDTKKAWSDLWNSEGDSASKAMQKRIDARKQEHAFVMNANAEELKLMRQNSTVPPKKKANFSTGGEGGASGAEALSEYDKLIKKLNGELVKAYADAEAAQHGYTKSQAEFIAMKTTDEWKKLSDAQKNNVAWKYQLIEAEEKLRDATKRALETAKQEAEARSQARKVESDSIAAYFLAQQDGYNQSNKAIRDGNAALIEEIAVIGMSKDQLDMHQAAVLADTIARKESQLAAMDGRGSNLTGLQSEINLLKERAALLGKKVGAEDMVSTANAAANAWKKASNDIANSLTKAFGTGGAAIGNMVKIYMDSVAERADADKDYEDKRAKLAQKYLDGGAGAEEALNKLRTQHQEETTKNAMGMYGDMAGAAAGFFDKQSTGYRALTAVSQVFHAAELAMSIAELVPKALGAVLNQGNGDPYTAFGRIAAMAAVVAGLGVAIGGGGSSGTPAMSSKERQEKQGTGSVFGDDTAKSESIGHSIELLAKNSDITLVQTNAMLNALNSIRDNILGVVNAIVRTSGLRGGPQDTLGMGLGSSKGAFGFSSQSKELVDQGIAVGEMETIRTKHKLQGRNLSNHPYEETGGPQDEEEQYYYTEEKKFKPQTIGAVRAAGSLAGSKYSSTHSEESSWWGLSQSSSDETIFKDLDKNVKRQMGLTVISIANGVQSAAEALGMGGEEVRKKIDAFNVDIGLISLKGLTGQALQDELNAVFSKFGDGLAESIAPGLDDFQKVGEGYMETLFRVASGIEKAKVSLELLGITAINFKDIVNKQGDVPTEIIRQSVVLKETVGGTVAGGINTGGTTSGIGKIIQGFNGGADDMLKLYTTLLDMRKAMVHTGASVADITLTMVTAAGSVDALKSGIESYYDLFFSEEEKRRNTQKDLEESFASLGVSMPASTQGFRDLVNAQDLTTDAGQKMYAKLMLIAPEFGNAANAAEAAAAATRKAAEESKKATTQSLSEALAPFRPEANQESMQAAVNSAAWTMTTTTGLSSMNEVLGLSSQQIAGMTDKQREAITAYANAQNAADQYNKALKDAQLTYEEAVMKHGGATDLQVAQFQRANAASEAAKIGVHNMAEATDKAYIASLNLTPAQLALVTAYVNTDTAVSGLTNSLNETAQAAYQAQQSLASQQIDSDIKAFQTKMSLVDQAIKDASGGDFGQELTKKIAYISELTALEQQKAAAILATSPNGTNYAPYIAAQENIRQAQEAMGQLTRDYLLYVQLEGQYAGHGRELVTLQNDYEEKKRIATGNGAALLLIEESYQKKRQAIIDGTLSSGLSKTSETLFKWLDNLKLSSSLSPLTAQQQKVEAENQYVIDLAKANAGDATALANITKDAEAYLNATKAVSGFGGDYSSIFAKVQSEISGLAVGNIQANKPLTKEDMTALILELTDMKIVLARLLEKGNAADKTQADMLAAAIAAMSTKVTTAANKAALLTADTN